jgi:signal transduction histidine kinase
VERFQKAESAAAFVADIPHDLPAVVVDPVHAGQVLDNLLSNALQAMDGSPGTVRVCARATGDGFVRLEVSDTGPGIPKEHFAKVFEPLFTTKARGIGLGLALSKSLAQANGGDLALVSAPDQSATFAFILPVAEGSA